VNNQVMDDWLKPVAVCAFEEYMLFAELQVNMYLSI
jgi:hypothetical protein